MIRLLQGVVAHRDVDELVVVCGGVGYAVQIPANSVAARVGDEVTLWTHQRVREDALDLFGFATREELLMFEAMQKIQRFPAKSALAVLARLGVDGFRQVIAAGDLDVLTKVPGIGKKTAQQMLLELRGQIVLSALPDPGARDGHGREPELEDAALALVQLGFAAKDARARVEKVHQDHPKLTDTADVVKCALQGGIGS